MKGSGRSRIAQTFVCVPDPSVRRYAVALEADTEVLALGGDPVFEPAVTLAAPRRTR
jgi:hypothetical protein